MADYNGHPSWQYWNVSLWVRNDEGLYNLARECCNRSRTRKEAAQSMLETLRELGEPGKPAATPDGAIYSVRALMHAMRGM